MTTTRIRKVVSWISACVIVYSLVTLAAGCGANEGILRDGKESPPSIAAAGPDTFEKDIAAMKEADFNWTYIIRRIDGGELNAEDKRVIKANAPETNRRVLSDSGKAVIIGSNYFIGDANLKVLMERFDVGDQSKPDAAKLEPVGPTPQTTNKALPIPEKKK